MLLCDGTALGKRMLRSLFYPIAAAPGAVQQTTLGIAGVATSLIYALSGCLLPVAALLLACLLAVVSSSSFLIQLVSSRVDHTGACAHGCAGDARPPIMERGEAVEGGGSRKLL